jgi:hypothetical protein
MSVSQSRGRVLAATAIILVGLCLLTAIFETAIPRENAATRDYIGYWAAGQQIVHGANPYSLEETVRLEESVGLGNRQVKITPSPPVGLALVIPLGFVNAKNGLVFWLMIQILCLAAALWILWLLEGKPSSRIHLLGFLFPPALACLMAGQLGIFCLLGITLFLWLHDLRPFLAGMALLPVSLKPHLFLPVALVLLLWVAGQRRFRLLAGFLAVMAASYGLVVMFDPHAWAQYTAMLSSNLMRGRFAPTLSAYLRLWIDPRAAWLQYLPTIVACLWSAGYMWKRWSRWSWVDQGLLVLLVSLLCAPYAWLTDEAVLLPAVLFGVYRAIGARRSLIVIALFVAAALVELFADVRITAWYYTWTTPAWFGWYLCANRPRRATPARNEQTAVP